ncbi:helix-turn-helix domain-containing protein [Anaerocolumna sp. MB42-C2]|uniref:helix-turn-helix domain-containing protein n=1 Tax=Anaerocolumna sp. MB42-C2 TaxID=3070997 RepID=UPI0027DF36C4|nr:AraC family transcriptional regulator [Anaerocolumna sp. MB42-C2]WMJ86698.1 AraC family transcriptional regulator [Anaerocolumna sp. MB42-C2]
MKLCLFSRDVKGKSNHKRFFRYLSKYLIFSCVISLAFIPIYAVALNSTKENAIHEAYRGFETGLTRTNGILNNLVNIADAISREQDTARLSIIQGSMGPRDYMSLMKAQNFMVNVLSSDNMVKNAYTLFKNNNLFLSKSLTSADRSQIYNDYYKIEGISEKKWIEMVFNTQKPFKFIHNGQANWTFVPRTNQAMQNTIHIAVPSLSQATFKVTSVTVFMLAYDDFFLNFGTNELIDNSFIYLTDRSGMIALNKNYSGKALTLPQDINTLTVNGKSYTVMKAENTENGIRAVIGIPDSYFKEKVSSVYYFIVLYSVLILVICILASIVLAYYQYFPVKKMIESIQKVITFPTGERNEYRYISEIILSLDNKSKRYEEELRLMSNSIYNNLLDRMLNGKILTREDEEKCKAVFQFNSDYFLVCLLKIEQAPQSGKELDTTTKINALLRELLSKEINFPMYFYSGEIPKISIIFNLPEESRSDPGAFSQYFNKVTASIQESCGVEIITGIGTIAYGIKQVVVSSTNAQDALRLSHIKEPVHTWFDRKKNRNNMFLGNKTAQRLYEILLIGDPLYVEEDFNLLIRNLSKPCLLTETDICQSFYVMRNTLESASYDILNADEVIELPEYSKDMGVVELFSSFYKPCIDLCSHKTTHQCEEDLKQKEEIINFIKNNYTDSKLCAMTIGDKFYISEKYVFTIIKSLTGKSLGEFIEQLRFAKVEELLRSSVDINEIPALVGFNSVNTFYKAFKRKYGVSPGKWRSQFTI